MQADSSRMLPHMYSLFTVVLCFIASAKLHSPCPFMLLNLTDTLKSKHWQRVEEMHFKFLSRANMEKAKNIEINGEQIKYVESF